MNRREVCKSLALGALAGPVEGFARAQPPREKAVRPHGRGIPVFNRIVEDVMAKHGLVGATMAVAREGRLVLAEGYGLANLETKAPVLPRTLFSVASVSKAISAVAALKLVERGKVALGARLIDVLDDVKPRGGERIIDPRFREITVERLLHHSSGLPRDRLRKPGDVPAADDQGEHDSIVSDYRIAMGRRLEFDPGSDHRYSNLGFLFVRLVIEKASGLPYQEYVRDQVLKPMGISRMVLERPEPIKGETGRFIAGPNGVRAAAHVPHNWLATAADMTRFLTALTGARGKRFLTPRTFHEMVALPPPPIQPNRDGAHVGLGWDAVRRVGERYQFSKNGGKTGVSAWLEHLPSGVDWAFMLNTTPPKDADEKTSDPAREIIGRMHEAIEKHKEWPEVDLFDRIP